MNVFWKKKDPETKIVTIFIRFEDRKKIYSLDVECVGAEIIAIDFYIAVITNYLLELYKGKMYDDTNLMDIKTLFMVYDHLNKEVEDKPYLKHKGRSLGKYAQRLLPKTTSEFRDFIHSLLIQSGEQI